MSPLALRAYITNDTMTNRTITYAPIIVYPLGNVVSNKSLDPRPIAVAGKGAMNGALRFPTYAQRTVAITRGYMHHETL